MEKAVEWDLQLLCQLWKTGNQRGLSWLEVLESSGVPSVPPSNLSFSSCISSEMKTRTEFHVPFKCTGIAPEKLSVLGRWHATGHRQWGGARVAVVEWCPHKATCGSLKAAFFLAGKEVWFGAPPRQRCALLKILSGDTLWPELTAHYCYFLSSLRHSQVLQKVFSVSDQRNAECIILREVESSSFPKSMAILQHGLALSLLCKGNKYL